MDYKALILASNHILRWLLDILNCIRDFSCASWSVFRTFAPGNCLLCTSRVFACFHSGIYGTSSVVRMCLPFKTERIPVVCSFLFWRILSLAVPSWLTSKTYLYYCSWARIGGRRKVTYPLDHIFSIDSKKLNFVLIALILMEIPGNFDRSLWSTIIPRNWELHGWWCRASKPNEMWVGSAAPGVQRLRPILSVCCTYGNKPTHYASSGGRRNRPHGVRPVAVHNVNRDLTVFRLLWLAIVRGGSLVMGLYFRGGAIPILPQEIEFRVRLNFCGGSIRILHIG